MSKYILLLILLSIFIVNHTEAGSSLIEERTLTRRYREYKNWFTSTQCRMIERLERQTWSQCKSHCNHHVFCTAFNWKDQEACEIRACGKFPPYPRGRQTGKVVGWKGFSKYYIDSSGWYYGPYGQYWTANQGVVIGTYKGKTRVECENICDSQRVCGGFNYNRAKSECVMKRFNKTPPPLPTGQHYSMESFSATDITAWPGPLYKCPSFHCQEENIDPYPLSWNWFKRFDYCHIPDRCFCHSDPFCYWKCPKCDEYRHTNY